MRLGHMTSAAALVTRRGGEEVIWREALVMNPRMTETCIDDFIATPTDMGPQTEYKRLVQNLNMCATRASANRRHPVDSQSLSNDEWRKMQRENGSGLRHNQISRRTTLWRGRNSFSRCSRPYHTQMRDSTLDGSYVVACRRPNSMSRRKHKGL